MLLQEQEMGGLGHPFPIAETTTDELRAYFDDGFAPRLYNPLDDGSLATERLLSQREEWRDEGSTVVFTSGVFDVMHVNHRIFLLATKLSAMPTHYARNEAGGDMSAWDDLDPLSKQKYTSHVLASGLIKQVVSVDGDDAVAERKGFSTAKANMDRPIYGWESRSRDVLSSTVPLGDNAHILAEAVTIHDRVEPRLADGPHSGIIEIGLAVNPDVWAIYHESTDIVEALQEDRRTANRSAGINPVVVKHSDGVFVDSKLGGPFSTTALARRIGGVGTAKQVA